MLNLTGFSKADWKVKGEDLMEGKVTVPVVVGLKRSATRAAREELWRGLQLKSKDPQVIKHLTGLLVDCGAIAECHQLAGAIVDEAWRVLSPLIPDSYQKLMIRAFAHCILTRVS